MSNQRLINAGATLANIAFNLAQRNPGEFTARDIMALDQARKDWDASRSEPEATPAPGTPPGFKLVPVKVTKAMQDAWDSAPSSEDSDADFAGAYRAMLEAAPGAPGQETPELTTGAMGDITGAAAVQAVLTSPPP